MRITSEASYPTAIMAPDRSGNRDGAALRCVKPLRKERKNGAVSRRVQDEDEEKASLFLRLFVPRGGGLRVRPIDVF